MPPDDDESRAPEPAGTPGDLAAAAMAARPEHDALARTLRRARVGNQLFATAERVELGRYHLLERVGAGGMGVVWGAWDPELERRVAIKLVRSSGRAARDRILVEGQALARLSHPHVVPVYDVGVVDDQVYLVMEWVRGKDLRAFARDAPSARELIVAYRQAGLGLAAAHAAGLVHRDFKPDNAIRGDDGRVRVLDFGLARDELHDTDPAMAPAGTPRYMAPEQRTGAALTAAVDQYALCVALREAIPEPPRWLGAVLDRGADADPARRFVSMDDLVRALGRDPRTVWRRRAAVAAALAASAGAFAIGSLRNADRAACASGAAEIGRSWLPQRGNVIVHLAGLSPYAQVEAARLAPELDGYARGWAVARDGACRAHEHGELTPQRYDDELGCLARVRVAFDTTLALLGSVPLARLANAIVAARGLPDPERCADPLSPLMVPPARELAVAAAQLEGEIERARVLALAADPGAPRVAAAAVATAEQLGYLPLVARANLALGLAHLGSDIAAAIAPLDRAAATALEAGDDPGFVEAYAREIYALAKSDAPRRAAAPDPLAASGLVQVVARRLGPAGGFARALLYNNLGTTRLAAHDRAGARVWFEAARNQARSLPGNSVELAHIPGNLALATDDRATRDQLLTEEITALTRALGANHPFVLRARVTAGMLALDPVASATAIRDACAQLRALHPDVHDGIKSCSYELGWLAEERGDLGEARAAFTLASAPTTAGYLALLDGANARAATTMQAVVTELASAPGLGAHVKASDAYLVAAIAAQRLGQPARAIALATRGEALLAAIADAPATGRRLARHRALLAQLLAATEPARAREAATAAARWYREAGGYPAIVAALDAIARP